MLYVTFIFPLSPSLIIFLPSHLCWPTQSERGIYLILSHSRLFWKHCIFYYIPYPTECKNIADLHSGQKKSIKTRYLFSSKYLRIVRGTWKSHLIRMTFPPLGSYKWRGFWGSPDCWPRTFPVISMNYWLKYGIGYFSLPAKLFPLSRKFWKLLQALGYHFMHHNHCI